MLKPGLRTAAAFRLSNNRQRSLYRIGRGAACGSVLTDRLFCRRRLPPFFFGNPGDGGIVDEYSEIRPNSKRGSRRVRAEAEWLSLLRGYGLPVHIFRLAGIYGPGRSALDSVRAGVARRINKPGQVFNRIHVEDIVQVFLASMEKPNPGAAYNLADDDPVPSWEVITYACEALGLTPPPLIPYNEADMAPITRSFYNDNKRVANNRIKRELGVQLKYPDYKKGIDACLAAERSSQMGSYLPAAGTGSDG